LIDWVREGGPAAGAEQAWRTAVTLPRQFVEMTGVIPFVLVAIRCRSS
jgi:hypothetical protein